MKRLFLTMSTLAASSVFALPGGVLADPGGPNLQQPIALTCDDGTQVTVSPGTLTNQGRVAWA